MGLKSRFEALLAFKTDVQRFEEVFNVLDEDSNGGSMRLSLSLQLHVLQGKF